MILTAFIAILLPTLLGFFIIAVILRNEKETPLGERIGLSFPLGAGIITLQMFLLGIVRIPLTLFNCAFPVFVELAILAVWIWRQKIILIPRPAPGLFSEFTSPQNHWLKKCAFAILLLWIGAKICSVFLETGLRPIYSWDGWTVWSAGAKTFYYTHSLMLDASAQDFFGKSAVHRIMVYPLHSHLIQVWISLWSGTFDDVLVKFHNPVYFLSMAVCFYYISIREIKKIPALILLVIVLGAPLLSYHAIEGNSDLMLSVYLFLASGSFLKAMKGNAPYCVLTGIYSAEALLTKQEAFFFILPLLLSAIVYFKFDIKGRAEKSAGILPLLTPFLAVIPWYIFTFYYGLGWEKMADWIVGHAASSIGADSNGINPLLTFHPEVIIGYFYWLASLHNFNVIIFFLPLLLIAQKKLSRESLHILFPIVCYMLFFLSIYMFTRYYAWFLMGTIFYRNVLTCYPVICLLTILLLKNYDSFKPASEKYPC